MARTRIACGGVGPRERLRNRHLSQSSGIPTHMGEGDAAWPGRSTCTVPKGQSPTSPHGEPAPANPHHLPTPALPPTAPTSVNGTPLTWNPGQAVSFDPELLNWTCRVCLPPRKALRARMLSCLLLPSSGVLRGRPSTGAEVRSPGRPEQGGGGTLGHEGRSAGKAPGREPARR